MLAESRQDYDRALDEYAAALRINPDIIDALNNQAFVYAHLGRWGEATANFKRIIELTPNKAVAHLNLSVAYSAQQRFVEAAREKQIAIELGLPGALELMRPRGGQK
jgi:tetratricopeptide (TPR) repeat protein